MRTKLLTLLIVLGAIIGSVASTQAQTYQWDFQKYFYIDPALEITSCEFTQLETKEYVYVLGVREPSTMRGYFKMVKLDPFYNVIQTNSIGHCSTPLKPSNYIVKDVTVMENGNIMIAGSMEKYCNCGINGQGGVLLTVTSNLGYVDFNYYENIMVWNSVLEAVDGYAVCGQDKRYQGIVGRYLGNNWSLIYHVHTSFAETSVFNELTTTDKKQFGAVGTMRRDQTDVLVVRFDESNIQFANHYFNPDQSLWERGMSIIEFKDEYVIAGMMKDNPSVELFPLSFKVEKYNGNWMSPYSAIYDLHFKDLEVAAIRKYEDIFYISGTIHTDIWSSQPYDHGFIFGFRDADPFHVIENRYYGDLYQADIYLTDMNMNVTQLKQPVTGGYSDNFGNQDLFWIIERFENINDDCHSKRDLPPVHEYPMEFHHLEMEKYSIESFQLDYIHKNYKVWEKVICEPILAKSMELDSDINQSESKNVKLWTNENSLYITGVEGPFEYAVYTLSGRMVESGKSASANFVKNISALKQGMYIVRVNTNEESHSLKFTR